MRSTTSFGRSLRLDPVEQNRGGLVAWILGDELAGEGALEDRAAESYRVPESRFVIFAR